MAKYTAFPTLARKDRGVVLTYFHSSRRFDALKETHSRLSIPRSSIH